MTPILSILIPSIAERLDQLTLLQAELQSQIEKLQAHEAVEILALTDNASRDFPQRSVGLKRQGLLDLARGHYIAYCDDDDTVSPDYLSFLLEAARHGPDVITFLQTAVIEGIPGQIHFSRQHQTDEPWRAHGVAKRRPWHVCAWRRERISDCIFTDKSYGEDRDWVDQAAPRARHEVHIHRPLHTYYWSAITTAAPPPAK